jgi:Pro-kumamolisin, activation domain/Calx-beta domain
MDDRSFSPIRPLAAAVLALAALYSTSTQALPAPQAGGTRVIDESDRVVLRRNVNPLARPDLAVGRTKADLPMDRMILSLALRPGAQAELDQLLAEQQDPASPNYHQWLTPEEFGTRFGPPDADVAVITGWLRDQGFRIDDVARGRGWINFSGTAGQVESAFLTEMNDYRVDGKLRHANALDPSIPRGLAGLVHGVVSLNSFPRHPHIGKPRGLPTGIGPDYTSGSGDHFLAPADFATIYNVAPLYGAGNDGTGVTIAIVGRSDILLSDVKGFRSIFGLPANDPVFVHNGPAPGRISGDELESDLDVEWAGAVAPRATVKFVISNSTNPTDGIDLSAQYVVDHNLADTMSTSYGLCEAQLGSGNAFYNGLWAQAAAEGITSFVSSGDSGAAGCDTKDVATHPKAVSGLCSTPNNVCVGGSQFDDESNPSLYWGANDPTTKGSALSYIPETSWNESGGGNGLLSSGGGVSTLYSKPSWQSALGVPADGKRDVPDVSLTAALHDGYFVYQDGNCCVPVGGTSAASPSFAGLMALVVQKTGARFGNANSLFYQFGAAQYGSSGPTIFHDVTTGNNSVPGLTGFSAGTGYDLVTGLGSVDASALIAAFANLPKLSVSDVAVVEGNGGTVTAAFSVTLSAASTDSVTVHYATADGTAKTASGDYIAASGTLTFTPGQTSKTVNVTVNGDTLYEGNETFTLNLSLPLGAQILDGQGVAAITNDDTPPSLSIGDVFVAEGNSGTRNASFVVTLSTLSGLPASVAFTTADGTAAAGLDYTAVAGTLTIPAGHLTGTINIPVKGDGVIEDDETFFVNLSSPVGVTIADGQGQGTILNDDTPGDAQFSAAIYKVSEASSSATVTVRRVNGKAAGATVDYATADGTAVGAGNQDYTPTSGTLTFGTNKTSASFKIPITRDILDEGDETVLLRLSPSAGPGAVGLGAQSTAVLTIRDNDTGGKIRLSSANYSVSEGAGSVKITVKRSGGRAGDVTVHYATSADTATGGGTDYSNASGDLTFATSGAGAAIQTFTIPITQDLLPEGAERFKVTLSSPTGGGVLVSPTVATVTILDDESTVEFSADAYTAKETQANALVTVKRTGPTTDVMTVDYATGGGTATPDVDYKSVSGTLTFTKGVTSRTFVVPMIKDTLVEGDETVGLALSSPSGTVIGAPGAATLTIVDDDATPTVQFSAATYKVNESMPKATISVKRTGNVTHTITVGYQVTGGTATNGGVDYDLPVTGTLTFNPRVTTQTILVPLVNDGLDEGTETVLLALQSPQDVDPGGPADLGLQSTTELDITDNEPTVQFSTATYKASEAAKAMIVTVKRTGDLTGTATVTYDVTGGTATRDTGSGGDYAIVAPGTLTFLPKQSVQKIPITLNPDTVSEGTETVELTLSPPTGAGLGAPNQTEVSIKDNDKAGKVQFSATDYSVAENAGIATITVTRSGGTSSEATVQYSTSDGSAAAGTDYTATSGTLTFGLKEKSATFTIPVADDGVPNAGAVSVDLTLDTPDNGVALGSVSSATLWIVRE